VYALAFSPDGKTLASGSADESVRLWDVASGRQVMKLTGHKNEVVDLAFSPNGGLLLSAAGNIAGWPDSGGVKLWDVTTGKELATFNWPGAPISLAVSADGRTVAVGHGGDTCVKLLDGRTLRELATLQGHTQEVRAVATSPDGQFLATAGDIGDRRAEVIIWQLKPLAKYREISEQADSVCSLAFAPDGVTLASGSRADTIRLWNIHTGQLRALLRGHRYSADSIAFSPDGQLLASGGPDGVVRVWDLSRLGAGEISDRVAPGGCPPGAPTDPNVRD
jgi:WD40 repeat protein